MLVPATLTLILAFLDINADIKQYSAGGIRWLMVRDEFGNYIYSWPENDSIDANNRAELGHSRPDPLRIGR